MIHAIDRVRWWTSTSCLRILERLACKGPAAPDELAAELHNQEKYAYRLLRHVLRRAGRVHVCAWRHNISGRPTPVYAIGPGIDKPEPKPETPAKRAKRRRIALNAKFGKPVTQRLLNPGRYGRPQIHIDGRRVRTLDHGSQLVNKS